MRCELCWTNLISYCCAPLCQHAPESDLTNVANLVGRPKKFAKGSSTVLGFTRFARAVRNDTNVCGTIIPPCTPMRSSSAAKDCVSTFSLRSRAASISASGSQLLEPRSLSAIFQSSLNSCNFVLIPAVRKWCSALEARLLNAAEANFWHCHAQYHWSL